MCWVLYFAVTVIWSDMGILVLLIVGLDRWRMLLVICRMALYTEVTYYNAGSWIFLICAYLRVRHQAVWREAHGQDPCSCLKKPVAYHNWFALPERPVSDARAPFALPDYLKMALSKSIMRNVARFRIWGHGLKCETGLYGRSFILASWNVHTHTSFILASLLKKLLGVKKGTDTHCVLRETGQMPIFFYWFRCTIRFWNSLLSSNNPLLAEKIVQADLLLANRNDTWTYQVLHALQDLLHLNSFWMPYDLVRLSINDSLNSLYVNISLGAGKILTPHEAHHSSRIMRTYHTHFGVPLGNTPKWWDDRKRNQKPMLPLYLRLDIPSNLSRELSCLRLSGHNFLVQRMRHDRNRWPYELRICDRCDWHTIQDEEHILLNCPHEHLVRLRTQQQLIFPSQFEDGPARLRTFMN